MKIIRGIARKIGDHVDTDAIIPARYCTTIDTVELGRHILEGHDPEFPKRIQAGDILVAGKNFGCGSAREHAALAIAGAGVCAVIAHSFSRTFFRNAINIALPVFELPQADEIREDDSLVIDNTAGLIQNLTSTRQYRIAPNPQIVQQIIDAGGMVEFARKRLAEKKSSRAD